MTWPHILVAYAIVSLFAAAILLCVASVRHLSGPIARDEPSEWCE